MCFVYDELDNHGGFPGSYVEPFHVEVTTDGQWSWHARFVDKDIFEDGWGRILRYSYLGRFY